jgi:MFS family permease
VSEAPVGEGVPSTFAERLSNWFGRTTQIVTGVAGFSYAFGWVLAARFYGSFGVAPEEAGISFSWLAIRAFLVGIAGLALFLGARWLLRAAERGRAVVHIVRSRAMITLLISASCVAVATVVSVAAWASARGGRAGTVTVVAILACGASTALVILWLRPSGVRLGWNSSLWLRGVGGAVLGFVIVGLVLLPYRLGDHLAADVREGRPVRLPMALGVPAFQVSQVRLALADGSKPATDPLAALGCVMRLGGNGTTSIYYARGRVLRIADDNVTVASPC